MIFNAVVIYEKLQAFPNKYILNRYRIPSAFGVACRKWKSEESYRSLEANVDGSLSMKLSVFTFLEKLLRLK